MGYISEFPHEYCTVAVHNSSPWRVYIRQRSLGALLKHDNALCFETLLKPINGTKPIPARFEILPPEETKVYSASLKLQLTVGASLVECIHEMYDWHENDRAYEYVTQEIFHGVVDLAVPMDDHITALQALYGQPEWAPRPSRRSEWLINSYRTAVGRVYQQFRGRNESEPYETMQYVYPSEVFVKTMHFLRMQEQQIKNQFKSVVSDKETRDQLGTFVREEKDKVVIKISSQNMYTYISACNDLLASTGDRLKELTEGSILDAFQPEKNAAYLKTTVALTSCMRKTSFAIKHDTKPYVNILKAIDRQEKIEAKKQNKKQKLKK